MLIQLNATPTSVSVDKKSYQLARKGWESLPVFYLSFCASLSTSFLAVVNFFHLLLVVLFPSLCTSLQLCPQGFVKADRASSKVLIRERSQARDKGKMGTNKKGREGGEGWNGWRQKWTTDGYKSRIKQKNLTSHRVSISFHHDLTHSFSPLHWAFFCSEVRQQRVFTLLYSSLSRVPG